MNITSGAVYNHYVSKLMDSTSKELRDIKNRWDRTSLVGKILKSLNLLEDPSLKAEVANDILIARRDPHSYEAEKVNWRIAAYRTDRADS